MTRSEKNWHLEFEKYMNLIVNHPNYEGMPSPFKEDGTVQWVVSGQTKLGKERAKWWDYKVKEMDLNNRAEVARLIHPKELKGFKPCQICGEKLNIHYVYPNKNTINRLKKTTGITFAMFSMNMSDIFEVIQNTFQENVYSIIGEVFSLPNGIEKTKSKYLDYILEHCLSKLSPGVMSNAPDRFDGFHTYNACCRSKEDTGRHKSNLSRYTQDRRAYENWAEGNWNLSNRLMGEFNKFDENLVCPSCGKVTKMSADHIGPISLGFTHRPRFNPLCTSCNSRKNNRITLDDVNILKADERGGDKVISWHSKYVWDALKNEIESENDALNLSKVMRKHLHNVLSLLALISSEGHEEFLKSFLHPEYSYQDYRFENFHPFRPKDIITRKSPIDSENKRKNAQRYIRIAYESLEEYTSKENRNVQKFEDEQIVDLIDELLTLLSKKEKFTANIKIMEITMALSQKTINDFYTLRSRTS